MLSLTVSQNSGQPLAEQIVAGVKRQIDDRHLRPGSKLPSIRSFAESLRRQPLHGGRGIRSAGGNGLSAITPRRRLLHRGRAGRDAYRRRPTTTSATSNSSG